MLPELHKLHTPLFKQSITLTKQQSNGRQPLPPTILEPSPKPTLAWKQLYRGR